MKTARERREGDAFSLVEVTLALGLTSFCLVAIFGLLPVGLNNNKNSIQQTAASAIISAVVSDLYATPVTTPARGAATTSVQYKIAIPANPITSNRRTDFAARDHGHRPGRIFAFKRLKLF